MSNKGIKRERADSDPAMVTLAHQRRRLERHTDLPIKSNILAHSAKLPDMTGWSPEAMKSAFKHVSNIISLNDHFRYPNLFKHPPTPYRIDPLLTSSVLYTTGWVHSLLEDCCILTNPSVKPCHLQLPWTRWTTNSYQRARRFSSALSTTSSQTPCARPLQMHVGS